MSNISGRAALLAAVALAVPLMISTAADAQRAPGRVAAPTVQLPSDIAPATPAAPTAATAVPANQFNEGVAAVGAAGVAGAISEGS